MKYVGIIRFVLKIILIKNKSLVAQFSIEGTKPLIDILVF